MKAKILKQEVEEFIQSLKAHKELWGKSLDSMIPDYPQENIEKLTQQSEKLSRKLGQLRIFIERFDPDWIMYHPATGVQWNALSSSVGLSDIAQIKGPSLRSSIEKLNQILGRIESIEDDEEIPEDPKKPIAPGGSIEKFVFGYLQHLHPKIYNSCYKLFEDGHFTQAIEESVKAVNQHLREITSLQLDGANLVDQAFSLKNSILAFSDLSDETKKNEQIGFMEMVKGFIKGVRHPLAHTQGKKEDYQKAFEYLVFASLICRRIDEASPKGLAQ